MLGDDILEALPELRAEAESLMTEQCVIEHDTGTTAYNEATHSSETVWAQVYAGKCRVRVSANNSVASIAQIFGQEINSIGHVGSLPFGATGMQAGDRLTITASDDPGQVGKRYTLESVEFGALSAARRFIATDNQG